MDKQFSNVIPGEAVGISVTATPAAQSEDVKAPGGFDADLMQALVGSHPVDV